MHWHWLANHRRIGFCAWKASFRISRQRSGSSLSLNTLLKICYTVGSGTERKSLSKPKWLFRSYSFLTPNPLLPLQLFVRASTWIKSSEPSRGSWARSAVVYRSCFLFFHKFHLSNSLTLIGMRQKDYPTTYRTSNKILLMMGVDLPFNLP